MDNLDNIEIAVTIPCFGHPGLMSEAILSLANFNSNKIGIVLVNDGCKYKETEIKGIIYQSQIKNLYYIKKLNGGLASARNAGIDYSLKLFKNLQYITFLDPDDRIETQEIIKASSFLNKERMKNAEIAWTYCHPYQMERFNFMYKGEDYNPLIHMFANANSATSIINVQVFKDGHRFDEKMRLGSEDWAFWIDLVVSGYRGIYYPFKLFSYRRRGESIGQNAAINHSKIYDYIKEKFSKFYNSDYVIKLIQNEMILGTVCTPKDTFCIEWGNFNLKKVDFLKCILDDANCEKDHLNLKKFFKIITILDLSEKNNLFFLKKVVEISLVNWTNLKVLLNNNTILELTIDHLDQDPIELHINKENTGNIAKLFDEFQKTYLQKKEEFHSDKLFFKPWVPKGCLGPNIIKNLLDNRTCLLANWLQLSFCKYIFIKNSSKYKNDQNVIIQNILNTLIQANQSTLEITPITEKNMNLNLNSDIIHILSKNIRINMYGRSISYTELINFSKFVDTCKTLRSIIIFDDLDLVINFKQVKTNRVLILTSSYIKNLLFEPDNLSKILDFEGAIDTILLPSDKYKFMFVAFGIPKEKIKVLGFLNFEKDFQLQNYEANLKPERNWNKILEVI